MDKATLYRIGLSKTSPICSDVVRHIGTTQMKTNRSDLYTGTCNRVWET
jgi:hypothetical protein